MDRSVAISKLENPDYVWDVVIIGGGASGLGAAVDAACRGYKTLLLEQYDFAKGTSSRSTKLVHGGVRYLAQGDISMVLEALRERGLLKNNAPHLFENRAFIIPNYRWWGGTFYTLGLKMYDKMAGDLGLGPSIHISKKEVMEYIPNLIEEDLYGGVIYHDGQFDDSRLAVNLAQTVCDLGGTVINYCKVVSLNKSDEGMINGVSVLDEESGRVFLVKTKSVVNATGVFVDEIMKMDDSEHQSMVMPSQGVHLVIARDFLPKDYAIMIPKTSDGRVLFAVPWHDKVVLGTTDIPKENPNIEPQATEDEVDFILGMAKHFLVRPPKRKDVLSVFAGLRPLAAVPNQDEKDVETKEISRNHKVLVSLSGLVTVIGGKWTTYRQMGEDVINKVSLLLDGTDRKSSTENLRIHGAANDLDFTKHWHVYGADLSGIHTLIKTKPELEERIHQKLPYTKAEVVWGVRNEMARTVEDILARRTRSLFLDAKVSVEMAPIVAKLMAQEMNENETWELKQVHEFTKLAKNYILES
jgi:glycerol-3-phosphate dehydrogenase